MTLYNLRRTGKQRNQRWLLNLTALTVLITPICLAEPIKSPTPFKRQPLINRDPCSDPKLYYCTELTDVQIGRYLLKVPYNLIGNWPPGNDFIELLPKWPGLSGRIKDVTFSETFTVFDIVSVMINSNVREEHPTDEGVKALDERFKLISVPVPELGLIEHRNPRLKSFAEFYTQLENSRLLPKDQPLMILRTTIPHSQLVHHSLGKFEDAGTYQCEFGYTLRDNLFVTVRFYDKHLKDWKEIVKSTQTLVESLLKE